MRIHGCTRAARVSVCTLIYVCAGMYNIWVHDSVPATSLPKNPIPSLLEIPADVVTMDNLPKDSIPSLLEIAAHVVMTDKGRDDL